MIEEKAHNLLRVEGVFLLLQKRFTYYDKGAYNHNKSE